MTAANSFRLISGNDRATPLLKSRRDRNFEFRESWRGRFVETWGFCRTTTIGCLGLLILLGTGVALLNCNHESQAEPCNEKVDLGLRISMMAGGGIALIGFSLGMTSFCIYISHDSVSGVSDEDGGRSTNDDLTAEGAAVDSYSMDVDVVD